MKKCKDCGKLKKQEDFYGIQGECKECSKKRIGDNWKKKREYYRLYDIKRQRTSFDRIFKHRFYGIKARVNGYAIRKYQVEGTIMFSKEEFLKWCDQKNNFKTFNYLFKKWSEENYPRRLTPSIDRIDNKKGYTLKNIHWITQKENSSKH
jgi:hypothetical protein